MMNFCLSLNDLPRNGLDLEVKKSCPNHIVQVFSHLMLREPVRSAV